jgi:uncharacterized protein
MLKVSLPHTEPPPPLASHQPLQMLNNGHKAEVLSFLAARPLHTFIQSSWIGDNGLSSPLNRGNFYGYRDAKGQLEGVALIGHITLFETQSEPAVAAFARLTQGCPSAHAVLSEENEINRFLSYYTKEGKPPRQVASELLLEKATVQNLNTVASLRVAKSEELELVVPIHAQTAVEESGVNPLDVDPTGFRQRCARRIEQGRVWVAIEDGRVNFKADIVSDTPNVIYLEGVYVSAEHRGNGYGARCMNQLTNHLLERSKSVCLLVNQTNSVAQACYQKAGFQYRERFSTVYLHPDSDQRS